MEYFIIIGISVVILVVLAIVLELNMKKLKEIAENKELNEITNSFPENIDICKSILEKLGNKSVNVKEDKESKSSLYVVVNNTITIANIRDSFTRIQTIAHECLHSIQSKKMLWFNFIYTNIYLLYFLIISILTFTGVIKNSLLFLCILIFMGMIQYVIRSMLENDAMIKARYVAKEYLTENKICSREITTKIVNQYDKLNNIGIKFVNYDILFRNVIKVVVYCVIAVI